MEKVLQSVVVHASHTSYKNGNVILLKYLFNGSSGLLFFDVREVFEAEDEKDLSRMDINKGKHLRKAM